MGSIYPIIALSGMAISAISLQKKSPFFNFIGILIAIYGGLKSAELIMPPLPEQVILLYMVMSVFAFLLYFSIREDTFRAFLNPLRTLLVEEEKKLPRVIVVFILIPLLAGFITYVWIKPTFEPPVSARIIHPEPPTEIEMKGKTIRLIGLENPLRKDTSNFTKKVEEGKKVYYQNCFFCHGADLDGKGHFAIMFHPPPLPFRGADTIAQLPESHVFWRIAKGWKGLPPGSHPWDTAMPAFEDFLSEDEIWKVSLFIYQASGNKPRTW